MYSFVVWFNNLGMWYNWPLGILSFVFIFILTSVVIALVVYSFICKNAWWVSFPASIVICFFVYVAGVPAINPGLGGYEGCMENKAATYEKCKTNLTVGVKKSTLKKWGYPV